ncbi:hypothetical protein ACF064_01590 [Streptomyces sp. NPDC015492]|uniref:hypothetical protein n=1 Tax=Streptomyces sp. NPDC015492 TaxID=3364958 RepID=UPI0036F73D18
MTSRPTWEYGAPPLPVTTDTDGHQDQGEPERCRKCTQRFDDTDTRYTDSHRRHRTSPFCEACVDRCHDTEIADHWCMIDQWRTDSRT